ncbi:uncharacterized protein LOC122713111 [Apis laboriosa]|uniref:uncharacterized protein LOC122713111 n=1 Tax=Apis laboriosa TaxID=183418 RepID=UPI001CC41488|nr:uncharacterized protein LOC122713111 [Apis laboriosa]
MAKLLHTFWAFLLNVFGLQIFGTCFANAMEDEDCESLILGSPFSSILFTIGVYIIIANSTLFPPYLHEPKLVFLALYEFLATAFILEFALACIWTPIDVLLTKTLPFNISYMFRQLGLEEAAISFATNKCLTMIMTYTAAIVFLLLTLHITDSVDYTLLRDFGISLFATHLMGNLRARLQQELPFLNKGTEVCRCKVRRRKRSKSNR